MFSARLFLRNANGQDREIEKTTDRSARMAILSLAMPLAQQSETVVIRLYENDSEIFSAFHREFYGAQAEALAMDRKSRCGGGR